MLPNWLRRLLRRGRESLSPSHDEPGFVEVGKAVLFGTEAQVAEVAAQAARAVQEREEQRRAEQRRRVAAEWLEKQVNRSPGGCWFPGDE